MPDTIIALADTHLGAVDSDSRSLAGFLDWLAEQDDVDLLVLNGDIFDRWRRDPFGCAWSNSDIIERIRSLPMDVIYVTGNHDHRNKGLEPRYYDRTEFVQQFVTESGGVSFHFVHGDRFDRWQLDLVSGVLSVLGDVEDAVERYFYRMDDWLIKIEDYLKKYQHKKIKVWDRITRADKSHLLDELWGLDRRVRDYADSIDEDVLVFGHTHDPHISTDGRIVNLGSWRFSDDINNTFLRIEDGEMQLYRFIEGEIMPVEIVKEY